MRNAVMDLEAEYNNRARVPDSAAIIAGWAREAEAFRTARDRLGPDAAILSQRIVKTGGFLMPLIE